MANKSSNKGSMSTGLKLAIIIGIIVIIALLITVIVLLVKGKGVSKKEEKRNVVVTQDTAEKLAEEMINEPYIVPGYYSTQMTTEWHFATGDAVSEDAYVKNDKSNTNDIYFDVFLEEDESTPILESPVIPRGSEMSGIKLDKPLKAGTYDCVMVYHLIDDEQNSISTLRIAFTIIVEK